MPDQKRRYPSSARRARALRIYCGFPGRRGGQKDFVAWLGGGVTAARWGMVERGETQFSYRIVHIIKQRLPTVDTGWLRDGVEGKMPIDMMKGLNQILEGLAPYTSGAS